MAFLLLIIAVGYLLSKLKAIPANSSAVLSKLENNVFIPALMLNTFLQNFTLQQIRTTWQYLVGGMVTVLITIPIGLGFGRLCAKDNYTRNVYAYGLIFSNFAFMGNAVVEAIFPEVFSNYLIFVLPFWAMIYLWGAPALLIPAGEGKSGWKGRLLNLVNPMFVSVLVGMALGLLQPPLPAFFKTAIASLGSCMSPVAMLLTGMTIAQYDLKKIFRSLSDYGVSLIRLLAFPALAIAVLIFLPLPRDISLCVVCALAMPMGLNAIVVPEAYGKDTSVAAAMALISHLMALLTVPLVFLLFNAVIK